MAEQIVSNVSPSSNEDLVFVDPGKVFIEEHSSQHGIGKRTCMHVLSVCLRACFSIIICFMCVDVFSVHLHVCMYVLSVCFHVSLLVDMELCKLKTQFTQNLSNLIQLIPNSRAFPAVVQLVNVGFD